MQGSILIHKSCIILQGLRNILNGCNIPVNELLTSPPHTEEIKKWKEQVIMIDITLLNVLSNDLYSIKKNRNILIAISENEADISENIDAILFLRDDIQTINYKIDSVLHKSGHVERSSHLTRRETEIIRLVALGDSNKQIAEKLFISMHTVITHRKNITQKLGIKTIAGLTLYAIINNLTD